MKKFLAVLATISLALISSSAWAPFGGGSGGSSTGVSNTVKLDTANQDVILARDAANTLALRNGAIAQKFNIYNTFTNLANYEAGYMRWSTNLLRIGTESTGTGTARNVILEAGGSFIDFFTGGTSRWEVNSTAFMASVDNVSDIGLTGNFRPKDIYASGHFRSEAATVPTMNACGTSPSVSGSDNGFTMTVGTGGVATTCSMNFGVAYTASPHCTANANVTSDATLAVVTTTSGMSATKATALTAGALIHVVCMGS